MLSPTSDLPLNEIGVVLPHCWICRNLLSDVGGMPHYVRNEHHVIPRAFGGADGPQVSLCSSHHDLLHFIALRMISNSPYSNLTEGLSIGELSRIEHLASRIKLASQYAKNDPNKKVLISFSLPATVNRQLSEISKFKNISKENVLKKLITESHHHLFPGKS